MLYEREAIAAGASGRNSGVVQHPLDAELVELYEESLEHYRDARPRLRAARPSTSGLLLVCDEPSARSRSEFPELHPTLLEGADLRAVEPALADGPPAWRLETGRPVPPAAAANAFALRAHEAGAHAARRRERRASMMAARPASRRRRPPPGGRGRGRRRPLDAKPSSKRDLAPFISPFWGVVVEWSFQRAAPRARGGRDRGADERGGAPDVLFSRRHRARDLRDRLDVHAGRAGPGGARARDPRARHPLPAGARGASSRGNAGVRAAEFGGRSAALGPLPEIEGLAMASGHGAWGITLGPASSPARGRSVPGEAGGDPAGPVCGEVVGRRVGR